MGETTLKLLKWVPAPSVSGGDGNSDSNKNVLVNILSNINEEKVAKQLFDEKGAVIEDAKENDSEMETGKIYLRNFIFKRVYKVLNTRPFCKFSKAFMLLFKKAFKRVI